MRIKLKTIETVQGSELWLSIRAKHFTASEAPAMLGVSKYKSRSELLREKSTGIAPDVDASKQRLFNAGHEAEEMARPLVEALLAEDLYPATGTLEVEGLPLLASFDGITMAGDALWETKLYNEKLALSVLNRDLEPHYWAQLEQQMLVAGIDRVYFTCTDGTTEKMAGMWYESIPVRRAQLIAGWHQFAIDLAAYVPAEVTPAAVAAPTLALPSLTVQVNGAITITDNLALFGEKLKSFIGGLDTKPTDDQGFADIEAAVKVLQKAQDALEAAEASALAQVASVDELRSTVKLYADLARDTRLMLDKLVKARKEQIKIEIQGQANDAIAQHIAALNKRLGKPYMPSRVWANFGGCMKGLKTVASIRNAVETEMARAKIDANAVADKIQINLETMRELATNYAFLFSDTPTIVMKETDDLIALIKSRIADHKTAEADKLEGERTRIRAEEEKKARAKIEQEQFDDERAKAEQDRLANAGKAIEERKERDNERLALERKKLTELQIEEPFTDSLPIKQAMPDRSPVRDEIIDTIAFAYGVTEKTAEQWLVNEFQQRAA